MKPKTNVIIIITLTILFMIGGHLLDIGGIVKQDCKGVAKPITTNGFWTNDAIQIYHIGYYLMYICFFITLILYVNLLFNKK